MDLNRTLSPQAADFIDEITFARLLDGPVPDTQQVREVIAKSMDKVALRPQETAVLLKATDPQLVNEIFEAARELKRRVYGNRIVLFAPLYIGNYCVNDCTYCSFRRSNKQAVRRTLSGDEIGAQVAALEKKGHKRLILVFGEHSRYDARFIAETVKAVYAVKEGPGEIRRVNINAAPMDMEGFRIIRQAGIGTYQIFMETYHHETYGRVHPENTMKGDYLWRLDGLNRAFEAGCDDVGIGALFGLYDWRFEVLGLVSHAWFLNERYGVGPHTISFPRLRPGQNIRTDSKYLVNDYDFKRLVAILRLSVPYTGMILTARESAEIRREVLGFGVSQIDAGSRIEIGGYTEMGDAQVQFAEREQFELGDLRPLDAVMQELLREGYLPSFCTSCYRLGRTGEHFMEYAIPGFIERYCTPNALLTLNEYLQDYASEETRAIGRGLIEQELGKLNNKQRAGRLRDQLADINKRGKRDICY